MRGVDVARDHREQRDIIQRNGFFHAGGFAHGDFVEDAVFEQQVHIWLPGSRRKKKTSAPLRACVASAGPTPHCEKLKELFCFFLFTKKSAFLPLHHIPSRRRFDLRIACRRRAQFWRLDCHRPERLSCHATQDSHQEPSWRVATACHSSGGTYNSPGLRSRIEKCRCGWPGSLTTPALCPPEVSVKVMSPAFC